MAYHGNDVCGGSCVGHQRNFCYYSHCRKAMERKSLEIRRSRFNFKLNPTSAIGNFCKLQHLASYVSRHNVMAYDKLIILYKIKQQRL